MLWEEGEKTSANECLQKTKLLSTYRCRKSHQFTVSQTFFAIIYNVKYIIKSLDAPRRTCIFVQLEAMFFFAFYWPFFSTFTFSKCARIYRFVTLPLESEWHFWEKQHQELSAHRNHFATTQIKRERESSRTQTRLDSKNYGNLTWALFKRFVWHDDTLKAKNTQLTFVQWDWERCKHAIIQSLATKWMANEIQRW